MTTEHRILGNIYGRAETADTLPWHREEPALLLPEVIKSHPKPGRAIDIGCGSGVDSVYLAERGWDVTSLDFVSDALAMTQARAQRAKVSVTTVHADILEWDAPRDAFDLVVDIGCLHSKTGAARRIHRDQVVKMLKPGGDYLLLHFEKRHLLDWSPIGPRRRRRADVLKLFAPPLVEQQFVRKAMNSPNILMGRTMSSITYWLHKPQSIR